MHTHRPTHYTVTSSICASLITLPQGCKSIEERTVCSLLLQRPAAGPTVSTTRPADSSMFSSSSSSSSLGRILKICPNFVKLSDLQLGPVNKDHVKGSALVQRPRDATWKAAAGCEVYQHWLKKHFTRQTEFPSCTVEHTRHVYLRNIVLFVKINQTHNK